ncbi:helix-turn-helix transcriptional regulator [Brevibacterium sp. UCMA 11752]|uniref:helix-turn-helix transcriptional regulator n=1 Tax=Brevibacterium sp. UCMA 11752 TaxID=2745946 RepID=UPI001F193088|nr:helix-turn-helix transcriptional regulator [Brevibacterium sp. UCMA 11752]MCF2588757.1 helix-turn-helix transcriptional regulator [Brevibacterium sp. UCMA 11752]
MDEVVDRKNPPRGETPPDHFYGRVLKPAEMLEHAHYSAVTDVAEELRPWVKRYWSVNWDLAADERYQTATVSEPTINLTLEYGDIGRANTSGAGIWLTGPVTGRRFDVGLFGRGGVIGVNFHLGGTVAFANESPATIRDTTVPARAWFPGIDADLPVHGDLPVHDCLAVGDRLKTEDGLAAVVSAIESWLLSFRPQMTEGYARFRQILVLLDDPTIISLGDLALHSGTSERSLQRLFQDHCGVGVKQILVRARIRDAIAAFDRGWDGAFGELAAELGWFDQSHFTADFHRVTGYTPTEYLSAHKRSGHPQQ